MDVNLHLLLITIGYVVSMIVVLGFGFFVLFQKERKHLYYLWFLFSISIALYQLSFIIGIHINAGTKLAYWIWYSNIFEDVLIGLFTLHVLTVATDGLEKFKNLIKFMYGLAILIMGAAIIFPKAFLIGIIPKLYFRSYVDSSGPLYYVIVGYFMLAIFLSYYVLIYERAHHGEEGKKRIDYLITGITLCFLTGATAFGPDFNLPIDPGFSALMGIFVLPLVYGIVKKGLMDIRIAIRRTVIITGLILLISIILISVSVLSNWLILHVPGFKFWMIPLLFALILVVVGLIYYEKEKGEKQLKYEFITVVAHKFRTPLTRIRWQTDELAKQTDLSPQEHMGIMQINESALELIHLSNLLINSSQQENYRYTYENISLTELVDKVLTSFKNYIASKNINLLVETEPNLPLIYVDKEMLDSAVHVLVENAITYTKEGGTIKVKFSKEKDTVKFSITDSGIGISDKDQSRIFSRFYRGSLARHADTEGVGLGLSMAKNIVEHQGGSIGFNSAGEGKGSTFWFTFLAQKK